MKLNKNLYWLTQHLEGCDGLDMGLQRHRTLIYRSIERLASGAHEIDLHANWAFLSTSEIEGLFGNSRAFIPRMYPRENADIAGSFLSCCHQPEVLEVALINSGY
jgi:hypothetical protein